jgi:hypothetical protein
MNMATKGVLMPLASRLLIVGLGAAGLFASGCDSAPAPSPVATQPTETDLAALRRATGGAQAPQPMSTRLPPATMAPGAELPSGHPPITGITDAAAPTSTSDLKFDVPPEWQPQRLSSAMRQAHYLLPRVQGDNEDGELILFFFGEGQGGTVEANLQRWRDMFTAEGKPVPDEAVVREAFDANGLKVTLIDVAGQYTGMTMPGQPAPAPLENYRMIGAVVETPRGNYFFRATGPIGTMNSHRSAIRQMLNTVKL